MRWLMLAFLMTCAGFFSAQVDLRVAYTFNKRTSIRNKCISNNLTIEGSCKRILLSASCGRETWYKRSLLHGLDPGSTLYPNSNADKLEFFGGYELPLLKDHLTMSFLYGFRHYFRNEVEKNLSFINYGNWLPISDDYILSGSNRELILDHYPYYTINYTYAYISQMRYAHLLKINVRYTYKNVGLSVYYLPNLIHFTYESPLEPKTYGSNYLLFHDLGVGLSYNFRFKSKKKE